MRPDMTAGSEVGLSLGADADEHAVAWVWGRLLPGQPVQFSVDISVGQHGLVVCPGNKEGDDEGGQEEAEDPPKVRELQGSNIYINKRYTQTLFLKFYEIVLHPIYKSLIHSIHFPKHT